MERKDTEYEITDERLASLDTIYLAEIVGINESHLADEHMRDGAEIRLARLKPELQRRLGVVAVEAA